MAVKNVTIFFDDGSAREFGSCAWSWRDGLLTIMRMVGVSPASSGRSVPVAQVPCDAIKLVDIEYDDDDDEMEG